MLSVPVPGGGSGKWYCKAPLANDFMGQVQAKSKKMSGRKSVSWTLYFTTHVAAICVKSLTSSKKSPKILWGSQRWLCQVCLYLMCHLQQLDLPSQNLGRITGKGDVKTLKPPKSFESFNRFGLLKRGDPGHGLLDLAPAGKKKVQRGGANRKKIKMSVIFEETISVAKKHYVALIADTPNTVRGDCLFECVIDNIIVLSLFYNKNYRNLKEKPCICTYEPN